MIVIVFGGRDFEDCQRAYSALDMLHRVNRFEIVVHGDARGADRLGRDWALQNGVVQQPFPANWDTHRRSAGPIRNGVMRDWLVAARTGYKAPDICGVLGVMFPGGTGTAHMASLLKVVNIPVVPC